MTGDRGADVPGISGLLGVGGTETFFRNEGLEDRLSELHIPDSEVENYVEALERGKTIIACFTKPGESERVAEVFRAASLTNVRLF